MPLGSWPGARKYAIAVLPETACTVRTVELMRLCSDARSAASDESRMRCAATVALFEASSTRSSCCWKMFDATLNEM